MSVPLALPPMLAIPDRQPIGERQRSPSRVHPAAGARYRLAAGAPTNLWLVGYDANAVIKPTIASCLQQRASQPVDAKAKAQLEQALSCTAIGPRFELAESLLKQSGWNPDQGVTPVTLAEPVKVYGFSVPQGSGVT